MTKRILRSVLFFLVLTTSPALAEIERWQGHVDQIVGTGGQQSRFKMDVGFFKSDEGALFSFYNRGRRLCSAVFGPAEAIGDMPFLGSACTDIAQFAASSSGDGGIVVSFSLDGTAVEAHLDPQGGSGSSSVQPDSALDILGVDLSMDKASALQAIETRVGKGEGGGYASNPQIFTSGGVDLTTFYGPITPGEATPTELFVLYNPRLDTDGIPVAVIRQWYPAPAERTSLGVLKQALAEKYGEPSTDFHAFATAQREDPNIAGFAWSYDVSGTKLSGAGARFCIGYPERSDPNSREARRIVGAQYDFEFYIEPALKSANMPDAIINGAPGCGLQLVAYWHDRLRDNDALPGLGMALFDAGRVVELLDADDDADDSEQLAKMLDRFKPFEPAAKAAPKL